MGFSEDFPELDPTDFPGLLNGEYQETSPRTPKYNCIAWAADDEGHWWWPDPDGEDYWPAGVQREETLDAFVEAYRTLSYEPCDDGELEDGVEKVAIFADARGPTHAARQLASGEWTSKIGRSKDIAHALPAVEGPLYGEVIRFMRRSREAE